MTRRIDYGCVAPGALHAIYALQHCTQDSGLEHCLLELVKLRSATVTVDGWNRLAIALGADVDSHQPRQSAPTTADAGSLDERGGTVVADAPIAEIN